MEIVIKRKDEIKKFKIKPEKIDSEYKFGIGVTGIGVVKYPFYLAWIYCLSNTSKQIA